MAILNIAMFIIPAIFSVIIHDYLRHGEVPARKKTILFLVYIILINLITYCISYLRGVKDFNFEEMTLSYRLKYMGLGCVLGFVMSFIVCLFTEDIITIGRLILMDTINIAFVTNIRFWKYTYIAIYSLLENRDQKRTYDIYIVAEEVRSIDICDMQKLIDSYVNVNLKILNPESYVKDYEFYVLGHFSKETYYRLVLPNLLPSISKVLYLDSDIIVKDDVSKIYDIDIENNLLAACEDPDTAGLYNGYQPDKKEYMDSVLRLSNPYSYFQAGVLLMNLEQFRKDFTVEEILEYSTSQKFQLLDQDILNHLCEGRVKYIDMSWNLMVDFGYIRRKCIISKAPSYLIEKYDNARQKPKIIHYAGPEKPWYYPEMDFAVEFWNVARKTKYYETILWNMSQHAADEVQKWHEKQIKHPVRDNIEKFRVFTLKIVPKDNKVRVALKNAVKKALKIDDKTKSKGDDWMPEIPNIYRKEI